MLREMLGAFVLKGEASGAPPTAAITFDDESALSIPRGELGW